MSPGDVLNSNPSIMARRLRKLNEIKNPDSKVKKSAWSRKDLLEFRRENDVCLAKSNN